MISGLRSELQQRRVARQKRAKLGQALIVMLIIVLVYVLVSFDDCPGKDIAELTDSQKQEVVSRWYGR